MLYRPNFHPICIMIIVAFKTTREQLLARMEDIIHTTSLLEPISRTALMCT